MGERQLDVTMLTQSESVVQKLMPKVSCDVVNPLPQVDIGTSLHKGGGR